MFSMNTLALTLDMLAVVVEEKWRGVAGLLLVKEEVVVVVVVVVGRMRDVLGVGELVILVITEEDGETVLERGFALFIFPCGRCLMTNG